MTPTSRQGKPALLTGRLTAAKVERQIKRWAEYLSLGSWQIRYVAEDPEDSNARADSHIDCRRKRAVMRLRLTMPIEQADRDIVHELLHVHLAVLQGIFEEAAGGLSRVATLRANLWVEEIEYVIERLVDAIVAVDRAEFELDGSPQADVWGTAFPLH